MFCPTHKYRIPLHLFVFSLISLINVLQFSVFHFLGSLVSTLFFLMLFANGTAFLTSFSDSSSLLYRMQRMPTLTLYTATLAISFINSNSFPYSQYSFLYTNSCHLQSEIILLPLFWPRCLLFLFFA